MCAVALRANRFDASFRRCDQRAGVQRARLLVAQRLRRVAAVGVLGRRPCAAHAAAATVRSAAAVSSAQTSRKFCCGNRVQNHSLLRWQFLKRHDVLSRTQKHVMLHCAVQVNHDQRCRCTPTPTLPCTRLNSRTCAGQKKRQLRVRRLQRTRSPALSSEKVGWLAML